MQDSDQEKSKEARCVECGAWYDNDDTFPVYYGVRCKACICRLKSITLHLAEKPNAAVVQGYKERIVCAALRHRVTGSVICGPRHFDPVMHNQIKLTGLHWKDADQGFVDQWGRFWGREMALEIALAAGQAREDCPPNVHKGALYSENLY